MKEILIQAIKEHKLIAIVRGVESEKCMKVAQALYDGGIRLMEITYNQKAPEMWEETACTIGALAKAFSGKMYVGAGTVTCPELVELTARVDALFRRTGGGEEHPVSADEISAPPFLLNTRNRTLEKNGQRVKLTQVEYAIVKLFMENPGKALSREEILDSVWGKEYFGELKIVDVNIRRLRIKIEDNPQKPTFVNTVWGYGYKWGG